MTAAADVTESAADIFARLDARLAPALPRDALDPTVLPPYGDHTLDTSWAMPPDLVARARAAAILIGLVERDDGLHVLLTQRTADLRDHAGQIAFPGGKIDPGDASPADTAIREAREEIGLPVTAIDVRGYLGAYLTGSGFRIIPVVARLVPPFHLDLNPGEVDAVFEVPFAHLMSAANHQLRHRIWRGSSRTFYAIEHGERTIWGITAGIIRVLYERLYL